MTDATSDDRAALLDRVRAYLNGPTASWTERDWERLLQIVQAEEVDPEDDEAVRGVVQRVSEEMHDRIPDPSDA